MREGERVLSLTHVTRDLVTGRLEYESIDRYKRNKIYKLLNNIYQRDSYEWLICLKFTYMKFAQALYKSFRYYFR